MIRSYKIQKGPAISIAESTIPRGLMYNELTISPLKKASTALVEPQEGQGMVVTLLKRQTPIPLPFSMLLRKSQRYPAEQNKEVNK
jgi:hypothetical protein